jgi:uncharacterized membrane protein (DUF441 family)
MIKEFAQILPEAMVIALNPVAICAAILLLLNQPGKQKALAYLFGWILGLVMLTFGIYLLVQDSDQSPLNLRRNSSNWLVWMGIFFLVLGIYELTQIRLKKPDEPLRLKWLDRLDGVNRPQVFGMGAAIAGLNLKNAGLIFSVLISLQSFKLQSSSSPVWVILVLFTILGSITIIAPVAYRYIKGAEAENRLKEWLQWLLTNSALVLSILFLFLGLKWIGAGLP